MKQQCKHPSVCPGNALSGREYCELHDQPPTPELGTFDSHELARLEHELTVAEHAAGIDTRFPSRRTPKPVERLLTFEPDAHDSCVLVAHPQMQFKPRGLMLWNAAGLSVRAAIIGVHAQLVVSHGDVPGEWFTTSQSFEQVVKAHAEGNEPGRSWGTWDSLFPGMLVRLVFDGPVTRALHSTVKALMWGHSDL